MCRSSSICRLQTWKSRTWSWVRFLFFSCFLKVGWKQISTGVVVGQLTAMLVPVPTLSKTAGYIFDEVTGNSGKPAAGWRKQESFSKHGDLGKNKQRLQLVALPSSTSHSPCNHTFTRKWWSMEMLTVSNAAWLCFARCDKVPPLRRRGQPRIKQGVPAIVSCDSYCGNGSEILLSPIFLGSSWFNHGHQHASAILATASTNMTSCSRIFLSVSCFFIRRPDTNFGSRTSRHLWPELSNCKMTFRSFLFVRLSASWARPFTHRNAVWTWRAWRTISSFPALVLRNPGSLTLLVMASYRPLLSISIAPDVKYLTLQYNHSCQKNYGPNSKKVTSPPSLIPWTSAPFDPRH